MKQQEKALAQFKMHGLPLGKWLSQRSIIAQDLESQTAIRQTQKLLANGETGMAVFFAHLGLFDMFGTALALERELGYKAIFPVAGSWYHFPLLKSIFTQLNAQVAHEFIPVYRKEEFGTVETDVRFLDFSGLDEQGKKAANQAYIQKTKDALETGGVVMLAPYGGRAPRLEHLRRGPIALLQTECPVLLSLTVWDWKALQYVVYFSQVEQFAPDVTTQEAHSIIYREFKRMATLSGVSEEKMLHSKSGSIFSRGTWRIVSKVLEKYLATTSRKKHARSS